MKYAYIIYLLFFYLFFLFFSLLVWDYIDIGLLNDNDFFKFFFFILSSFLIIFFSLKKYKLIELKVFNVLNLNSQKKKQKDYINFIYLFLLLLLLSVFFSFDPKNLIHLDIYHDGFQLVPAMNFTLSNKLWAASFIESGFFANYMSLIYFYFKKKITISSTLFIKYIILFLNKIILVSLAALITKELNFSNQLKIIFFIFFSLALLTLTSSSYYPIKQLLYLIFILLIYFNLNPRTKLNFFISSFLLGAITFLSLFWWIDIFIFNFLLLVLYLLFLYIRKEIKKITFICTGFLLFFLVAIFYFPKIEIISYLENLQYIILKANKYTSIEYPSPLFGQDGRATKTLIFFFYSLFLFVLFLFKKKTYLSNNLKKFLIFLSIGSLVSFVYALGRSDSPHIIGASGLLMTNLFFYNLYFLSLFFKDINFLKKRIISSSLILISLLIFIINIIDQNNIKNILTFKKNISNFFSLSDDAFLLEKNSNYLKLVKFYDSLLEKDECVQVLTDETIIPYIVKRKTCTKFFFYHTLLDEKIQRQFINELKITKPRFVLYKSDLYSPFNFFNKLKLVDEYINNNYIFYEKFDYWTFYKIK